MLRLGFDAAARTDIHELQACAAVGQMGLAQIYETSFAIHGVRTAQVLLTHADLADRERYLNARSTLTTLLRLGVVPIINENDTVVTDEIKFGDNDTLGALVANLIEADALVILTDQQGLYTADPRKDPAARLIARGAGRRRWPGSDGRRRRQQHRQRRHADQGAGRQARRALGRAYGHRLGPRRQRAGAPGQRRGDRHPADGADRAPDGAQPVDGGPPAHGGRLVLDAGAVQKLAQEGKSLLPIGVSACAASSDAARWSSCVAEDGREIARGLTNYTAPRSSASCAIRPARSRPSSATSRAPNWCTGITWCCCNAQRRSSAA